MILLVSLVFLLTVLVCAGAVVSIVSGLGRGYVRVGGETFHREDGGRSYWLALAVIALCCAASAWFIAAFGWLFLEQFCSALCQMLGHAMTDVPKSGVGN
jgi:hypothetical protein